MSTRLQLFCFRHAGGSGAAFFGWQNRLGPSVDVVPLELPRQCLTMTELADLLLADLTPLPRTPFAFYGHSMGALVAYHVARLLLQRTAEMPQRLLVGSFPAPHLRHGLAGAAELPDERLLATAAGIDGLPATLRDDASWRTCTARSLRADLAVCATGQVHDTAVPLPCPIEVFVGTSDPLVRPRDAAAWAMHTDAGCRVHPMNGGHFFVRESKDDFFCRLSQVLAPPVPSREALTLRVA